MILFIDDEERRMDSYLQELEFHYRVSYKKQVDEAYEFFEQHHKDIELLILDIMMNPGKLFAKEQTERGLTTGLFLYRKIRTKAPDLPILIFTHKHDIEKEFRNEPNCRFLRKQDYEPEQLVEAIDDFLNDFPTIG